MKISASIYSDQSRPLDEVIKDLHVHGVDLFHVDCNDDPSVFEDIQKIRELSEIPIDLHIISSTPERYFDLLRAHPVEFVTFQYEDLKAPLEIPADITGFKGLAITTPTSVSVFEQYTHLDFLLVMATIPGQSGGSFDALNFRKIREFNRSYPEKRVHVDGGVNAEVSFILRNLGVYISVSGSYLFKGPSVGNALINLLNKNTQSSFLIRDFCRTRDEAPLLVYNKNSNLIEILEAIEKGAYGFVMVEDEQKKFLGLVSMADVRRCLIREPKNPKDLFLDAMLNPNNVRVNANQSVREMLSIIRKQKFPITYLPVLDDHGCTFGLVSFVNLIKGEL